jgi:uncharacterized cupredoxin-like copper-binding protein
MKTSIRSFAALFGFALSIIPLVPQVAKSQSGRPQAVVSFGLEGAVGAANHVLIPNEVTIAVGGKVAFQVFGLHQPTIYRVSANTTRVDIGSDIVPGSNYVIADADAVSIVNTSRRDFEHPATIHDHVTSPLIYQHANPFDANTSVVNRDETLGLEVLFLQTGRYLVMCAVKGHLDDQMFGFVNVVSP